MADTTRKAATAGARQPITSHRLFPAIVALWSGALLGLASVAARPAFERFVASAGIDQVIPMAAPPLGTTFRILLALLLTGIGCIVGLLVARRLATPPVVAPGRRRPARAAQTASPNPKFGAAESDSDEEEEDLLPLRRRQLAIATEDAPVVDHVPIPGDSRILSVADLDLDGFEDEREAYDWADGLREPAAEHTYEDDHDSPDGIFDRPLAYDAEPEEETAPKRGNRLFDAYVRSRRATPIGDDSVPSPGFTLLPSLEEIDMETAAADLPELVDAAEAEPTSPAAATAKVVPEAPGSDGIQDHAAPQFSTAAERIASAPLGDLSHVELLERLAQALERRRVSDAVARATRQVEAPLDSPEIEAVDATLPAGLRAVDTEALEDDALPAPVLSRHIRAVPRSAESDDMLAQGYSSLRNLTREAPAIAPAADPVVAFPAQPVLPSAESVEAPRAFDPPSSIRRDSDDTEQALRAALATLQRMSGAA